MNRVIGSSRIEIKVKYRWQNAKHYFGVCEIPIYQFAPNSEILLIYVDARLDATDRDLFIARSVLQAR